MDNQRFLPRLLGGRLSPQAGGSRDSLAQDNLVQGNLVRDDVGLLPGPVSPGSVVPDVRPPVTRVPSAPVPLGRLGHLEVRLAETPAEIRQAQKLRYRVFYGEMSAVANARLRYARRDADRFDAICDHLLVIDNSAPPQPFRRGKPNIVGTYRLLRQEVAARHGDFYTQGEYDIRPLIAANPHLRFLELGRSCVLKPYRDKRTVELLWHGIWSYVLAHNIDVMLGCASLEGTDPDRLALPLTFLRRTAKAPPEWDVRALDRRRVEMDRLGPEIDAKAAIRSLPPLIKGYLRLGAYIGDGAVIDHEFGTTDVLIVLPVDKINPRYVAHYGPDASRYSG